MSSETSTDDGRAGRVDSGFQPWHFYFILAMAGATWAVVASRHTQPLALFVLSGAILAAGAAAAALHQALAGLFGLGAQASAPLSNRVRADLERDKALVLRSIKELEFDRAMGKLSEKDFAEMSGRLRARAVGLLRRLDAGEGYRGQIEQEIARRLKGDAAVGRALSGSSTVNMCASCQTQNDIDARFCKNCGKALEQAS